MSKLNWIYSFLLVVDENSFAAEDKKQGISTAAISRHISLLEASLKTKLLTRSTRRLTLTEIGSQYYQSCKKVLLELEAAETAIDSSQLEAMGLLRVVSNRYFAMKFILPHLPEFMSQHSKLQVNIELAERFPDFTQENIDLIFGVSIEGSAELVRKKVATTRYVLCASPAYLAQYGMPQKPSDLSQHHYITHSMRQPNNIIQFKNNKEVQVNPILWLNDSLAMCECAKRGLGIIKLHEYIVKDALRDKTLIEILSYFQEPTLPVYLYFQQNKYLQPKVRRFIDFYTTELKIDRNDK